MILQKELAANTRLFEGITASELRCLEEILKPHIRLIDAGEFLVHPGSTLKEIGIILDGCVHMISEDFWGNQNIISEFSKWDCFGKAHSISGNPMFFSLKTAKDSRILFLDTKAFLKLPLSPDTALQKLYLNLLLVITEKKLTYMRKAEILSHRSLREKISAFLTEEYRKTGTSTFTVLFNRQEMADYLSVDRCALSRELSKMQKEGILSYSKNHFTLITI